MPKSLLDLIHAAQHGEGPPIFFSDDDVNRLRDGTFGDVVVGGGGMVWLGTWSGSTLYLAGDAVERNGSTYIAIAINLNSSPPSANWDLVASKGNTGTTGTQGDTGAAGATGAQGIQGIPGLNTVTALTVTTLTGILKGDGALVSVASAPADYVATGDSRLTNARTPTAHATSHQPGGTDAMAVDAAAATGSLRTLGSGAAQATSGTDSRLSDARTPTAHTHPESDVTNLVSDLAAKQATLVSATNIKTINSASVLGSGDLVVTGSQPDIPISKLAPAVDETITAAYSAVLVRSYTVASGKKLTIGLAARMRIL